MTEQNSFDYAQHKKELANSLRLYRSSRDEYEELNEIRKRLISGQDFDVKKNINRNQNFEEMLQVAEQLLAPNLSKELSFLKTTELPSSHADLWTKNLNAADKAAPLIAQIKEVIAKKNTMTSENTKLKRELGKAKSEEEDRIKKQAQIAELAKMKRTARLKMLRNAMIIFGAAIVFDVFLLNSLVINHIF